MARERVETPKTSPTPVDESKAFSDFPTLHAGTTAIDVAKKWYEKHGIIPQAIGEDSEGKLATVDSQNVYWNVTDVAQAVYSRRSPDSPIWLLPGDPVVGLEFKRWTEVYGGPLSSTRPEKISARSTRDAAYFQQRAEMEGNAAQYAGSVELTNPANFSETLIG